MFVTAETARVRHEYVCRAIGSITPAEIKQIRERHGLSQSDLARITNFGEASISRWERGRLLPNASGSTFLKLLLSRPDIVDTLLDESEACAKGQEDPVVQASSDLILRFRHVPMPELGYLTEQKSRFNLIGCA